MSYTTERRLTRPEIPAGISVNCNPNSPPWSVRGVSEVRFSTLAAGSESRHWRLPKKDMTPSASTFPAAPSSELGAQQPSGGQDVEFGVADLSKSTGYENYFYTVVDGLVFHCLPEPLRNDYIESSARALRPGGRFFALVFSTDAFPPNADFGPRPFTEPELRETVGRHLIVDEVRPARAWVNVPRTLPDGFEYRNVTIGSDGRAQLPSFLVSAHRS